MNKSCPTFQQSIKSIEKLNSYCWPNFDDFSTTKEYLKEVQSVLFKEFEFLPNFVKFLKPQKFSLPIFRVREVESFTNISLFSEHSYPPINLTSFGRCNFPKNPVFYCSNDPMTALLEVVRDSDFKNIKYCISRWEIIDSDNEFAFQTFLHTELDEQNHFSILKAAEIEQLNIPFENKLSEDKKAGLKELIKFLHSSFINDKNYFLSASLAHRTLYAEHNFATDILLFPSVQTKFKGVNMAIHPNFVDNMMRVLRFYIVEIDNYNPKNGRYNITFSKYGNVDKNVIIWSTKMEDQLFKENIDTDFKNFMKPTT